MQEFSVLVGGKAGDGINTTGYVIAQLLNHMGYYVFMYYDYPSLIKGGHNFTIIRAADERIGTHCENVDFILALNAETLQIHKNRMKNDTVKIFNGDLVKSEGISVPVSTILKSNNFPDVMKNSAIVGAFAKAAEIPWEVVKEVFILHEKKLTAENLLVAEKGYEASIISFPIQRRNDEPRSLLTGNEAVSLGLVNGGLDMYISYPMTPSSSVLHFLAENEDNFGLKVFHPESEIAVILTALGASYAGNKVAVGTSGGGFCLMTEGLSLSGQAEIPVVIFMAQRPGPSTGLPTYSGQTDLKFILNAGQGEFPRFIVAPGDPVEAYTWSKTAMDIAWKYQVPSFILSDKSLGESTYSFDNPVQSEINILSSDRQPEIPYNRYSEKNDGISPMAHPPFKGEIIKVNSYSHTDEGITTEDPEIVKRQVIKREIKEKMLLEEIENLPSVNLSGDKNADTALVSWGSNKWICREIARRHNLRAVQPVVLNPFPEKSLKNALKGVKKLILVEDSKRGQLLDLLTLSHINVDINIQKFDGRPNSIPELEEKILKVIS